MGLNRKMEGETGWKDEGETVRGTGIMRYVGPL